MNIDLTDRELSRLIACINLFTSCPESIDLRDKLYKIRTANQTGVEIAKSLHQSIDLDKVAADVNDLKWRINSICNFLTARFPEDNVK